MSRRNWRAGSLVLACLAALIAGAAAPFTRAGQAEGDDPGLTEYEIACMPCHGAAGRGDGPEARSLAVRPADLTQIAKSNGGIFPAARVAEIIDGRAAVAAHGLREMPVWGERYRATRETGESLASLEQRVREQIAALVAYLAGIQE